VTIWDCGESLCEAFAACLESPSSDWIGNLRVGVDLGTANVVVAVVDSANRPVAGRLRPAQVVRDGIVVDFCRARDIVDSMVRDLEAELGVELRIAACAVPPGTRPGDCRATQYVVEGAGLEVLAVVDEPSAAARVLGITDGAVVDIGGGTTGISVLKDGKVIYTADEPTGGTHFTLVIAGAYGLSFEEAERLKIDPGRQRELFPILRPVMEKVAAIIANHIASFDIDHIYLVGGASALSGLQDVVTSHVGVSASVPRHPLLVTPLGIALMCPDTA